MNNRLATAIHALVFVAILSRPAHSENLVAYVSVSGEQRIARYTLDSESGALVHQADTMLDGSPGALTVSPDQRFLYAAVRSTGSVACYAIDADTGSLAHVGTAAVVSNPVYLYTDRTGKYLFTAYYGDGRLALYPLAADGTVDASKPLVLPTETNPHCITIDSTNRCVLVPNTGSDLIMQFRFDAGSGQLHASDPAKVTTRTGAGPRHVFFHPKADYVYAVNEKDSTVTGYRLDRDAATIHAIETLPTLPADFDGKNTCADVEVTPSGRFLYASNRGHDSLAGFRIDAASGRLTAIGQFATEATPRSFNVDPTEQFVVAAGQASGQLATYRLNATSGELSRLATYAIGKSPSWVQIENLDRQ